MQRPVEILATTQRPTFNADTKEGITEDFVWRDILYQSNYEPGSGMKVMTLASSIDNNTFPSGEYFNSRNLKWRMRRLEIGMLMKV